MATTREDLAEDGEAVIRGDIVYAAQRGAFAVSGKTGALGGDLATKSPSARLPQMRPLTPLLIALALLAACSKGGSTNNTSPVERVTTSTTTTVTNVTTPPEPNAAATSASAGFDPTAAPLGTAPTGAWPYFGLMDGYEKLTVKTRPGDSHRDLEKDVAFDRYDFFDGVKLIPVQGRLMTLRADGKGASFFQVQKTYEKLVKDLGGVTVFEGSGQVMEDHKLDFTEPRHRGTFRRHDAMGVYMARTPSGNVWVEVYQPFDNQPDNYWLTVVQEKPLEVKASMLPAEAMKKELDAKGQVALYINFDTDKATIKPDSAPIIAEVAKLLTLDPGLNLTVEGHTDNVGSAAHNQTLSEGRANAVTGALMAQGIAMARLQPKGYGQSKPLADNATEAGRAKNRRVELVKR